MAVAQEEVRFPIQRFEVKGNTLLSEGEIDGLLGRFVGEGRNFGDVQQALEALEVAYRRRGYTTVQVNVPEQELTEGTVRLLVTETRLGRVVLPRQLRYFDAENLQAGLPELKPGSVPNTQRLSQEIALNNENPAKQVEVVLGLGEAPGTVDARIKLEEAKSFKMFASLDNTGTRATGEHRLSVGVQEANLFNRDHVLTGAWVTSPEKPDQVKIGSLSYRIPFYGVAGALDFIYAHSSVDAGSTATTAGPLAFTGQGDIFGIRYTHALPRQGEYTSRIIVGWDWKAYKNTCTLGSFGSAGCGSAAASATVKPLSLTYAGQTIRPGAATDYNITLYQNIPGGAKGDDAAFQAVRPSPSGGQGARANYHMLRASVTHLHLFEGDWQLRLGLNAQWTDQALLSYEQLGLAGANTVRGFLEREVARDKGILLSVEGYSPDFGKRVGMENANLRALVFADGGYGRNNLLSGELQPKSELASLGTGLRYAYGKNLSARLDVARVMVGNGTHREGDYRGHFSVTVSY